MKRILKIIAIFAAIYLFISIALSVLVSTGVLRPHIIRNRSPFLIVEFCFSTAETDTKHGGICGYDQHGAYISHDNEREPGETITTIFVWNPFNNYYDDISIRIDF